MFCNKIVEKLTEVEMFCHFVRQKKWRVCVFTLGMFGWIKTNYNVIAQLVRFIWIIVNVSCEPFSISKLSFTPVMAKLFSVTWSYYYQCKRVNVETTFKTFQSHVRSNKSKLCSIVDILQLIEHKW